MEIKGSKNKYICNTCGGAIITVNVCDGATPFMIECRAKKNCRGMMFSQFCSVDQSLEPEYEWFMPDSVSGYSHAMKEHFKGGGLDLRKKEV